MKDIIIPRTNYTRFTDEYLFYKLDPDYFYLKRVARSFVEVRASQWLIEAIQDAVDWGRNHLSLMRVTILELFLANTYHELGRDEDRAVQIWKKVTKMVSNTNAKGEYIAARKDAMLALARHYFSKAVEAGRDSGDSNKYGRKLERLGKIQSKTTAASPRTNEASLLLGIWLYSCGRTKEAHTYFRANIKAALQTLSDGILDRDHDGYINIASVLLAICDDKNAIALVQLIWGEKPAGNKENDSELINYTSTSPGNGSLEAKDSAEVSIRKDQMMMGDSGLENESDDFSFICDGCYATSFIYNISPCRYCTNLRGFCSPCIALLKTDKLLLNVCSPRHDRLLIPPLQDRVSGKLFIDREYVDIKDWRRRLKEKWELQ